MTADSFQDRLVSTLEAEQAVQTLLAYIGEDSRRGGLLETPHRYCKALREMTEGYSQDPTALLKQFEDGAEGCDQMVTVRSIPFYSLCEHHMAPFFGTATIAYIPSGRVVGLSKMARVLHCFSRRLQVQERMTNQIADALQVALEPQGVGVLVRARHMCMESRGVRCSGSETVTTALRGYLKSDAAARSEFLAAARAN